MTLSANNYDVAIIGAGPAGLAAAALTARAGLSTLLLDENATPGGQIYRAIASTPLAAERATLGEDYWRGEPLVAAMQASGTEYCPATTVWSLDRRLTLGLSHGGAARMVTAKRVIIATGALERPFPIPGWTLPGVMSAGAAQTLLKSSGLVPDGETVLAGQGPLLWLLAAQILRAGGRIARILDCSSRANWSRALPHAAAFMLSPYFLKGLKLMREVKARVPVERAVTDISAHGEGQLNEVRYRTRGTARTLRADLLLLHQGVVPHVNLAMAAGVPHHWDEAQACFAPHVDAMGNTPVDGIAIAGDGAGIGGAEAAAARGQLAALAAIDALGGRREGLPQRAALEVEITRLMRGRAFIDWLFRPAEAFRIPADDATIVCRCEEVTAGDIRASIKAGATGPNQLKAYRRCGMGPCQGRLCGLTVTELMAAERGMTPQQIGYYRLRAPVKPVTVNELANMPQTPEAVASVVRG